MEKLTICRICLAEDDRMHLIATTHLHKMYEALTSMPFETEDSRPLQVCGVCFARLQECYKLKMRCLQSEEWFSQILNKEVKLTEGAFKQEYKSTVQVVQMNLDVELCKQVKVEWEDSEATASDITKDGDRDEHFQFYNLEEQAMIDIIKHEPDEQTSDPVSKQSALTTEWNVALSNFKKCENSKDTIEEPEPDSAIAHEDNVLITLNERNCDVNDFNKINSKSDHIDVEKDKSRSICIKPESYSCDSCQKSFKSRYYFEKHILTHTGETPHQCNVCKKYFSTSCNLSLHMRTHTGEKPFQCNVCNKCFSVKGNLNYHMRTHTGEKPFQCNVCKKLFSQKSHLNNHIRTHTGERPHQCNVCKKCFSQNSTLNKHIRTHTDEKPFQCNVCKKYFRRKGNLKDHVRIHTGEKL